MGESLKLVARLFYDPVAAMSAILDRGSLLVASISVLVVSAGLAPANPWFRFPFYLPLLILAVVYVPGVLALCGLVGRASGFVASFQRDYSPLATCAAMAWAAASIPLVVAAWTAPLPVFQVIVALAVLYFAVLMFFAIRTVFGAPNGGAAAVVLLSWLPLAAAVLLWEPLRYLMGW